MRAGLLWHIHYLRPVAPDQFGPPYCFDLLRIELIGMSVKRLLQRLQIRLGRICPPFDDFRLADLFVRTGFDGVRHPIIFPAREIGIELGHGKGHLVMRHHRDTSSINCGFYGHAPQYHLNNHYPYPSTYSDPCRPTDRVSPARSGIASVYCAETPNLAVVLTFRPRVGFAVERIAQPTKYRRPEIAVVPKAHHPSTRPDKPNRAVAVMSGTQGAVIQISDMQPIAHVQRAIDRLIIFGTKRLIADIVHNRAIGNL